MTSQPIDPGLRDESAAPGEDFYRYANGGWLATHPVPPEYGAYGAFHEVNERNQDLLHRLLLEAAGTEEPNGNPRHEAGDYFAAGMDEAAIAAAGVDPLRHLLGQIDALASVDDVRALAPVLQRDNVSAFHGLSVAPDFEEATAYLVYLGQGGLGLPDRDYYLRDDERSVTIRGAYTTHVAAQLVNLGQDADDAVAGAEAILAFEGRLAESSLTKEQQRDPNLTLNRRDMEALDALMPGFGLAGYVRELGGRQATVSLDSDAFFTALDAALAETPIETLRQYLRWHVVRSYASSLPIAFETEAFGFYNRTLGGQQEPKPRWKRVLDAATADIGELVSQLYVEAAFPPAAKARCEHLVEHLFGAMGRAIRANTWMTEETRQEALTKLRGFRYKIGYPDTWRDYSALDLVRSSFAENRLRAARVEYDRQLERLTQPVDKGEWMMPAHMVNAYYHQLMNEIVFPAGILQPPFFYADADDAVNFGGIGSVIGHEVTHGFDDAGSHFDAAGHLRDWWTEADRTEFERRADILVSQFDAYPVAEEQNVNGRLTLGENIADLGGVAIAFDALHDAIGPDATVVDGLTPAQRFFLSYASIWRMNYTEQTARLLANVDPHSPASYRANGPLSNFPAFAEAFGVADGAPMARPTEARAHIW
ncbi:MAG: M13 family metallopeptidase [Candidatus Limnocylindrales bacterium]